MDQQGVPMLDKAKVRAACSRFPKPADRVFQYGTAGVELPLLLPRSFKLLIQQLFPVSYESVSHFSPSHIFPRQLTSVWQGYPRFGGLPGRPFGDLAVTET